MTTASYEIQTENETKAFGDMIDASLAQLQRGGKLFRILPNGQREEKRPLTLDVEWRDGVPVLLRVPSFGLR